MNIRILYQVRECIHFHMFMPGFSGKEFVWNNFDLDFNGRMIREKKKESRSCISTVWPSAFTCHSSEFEIKYWDWNITNWKDYKDRLKYLYSALFVFILFQYIHTHSYIYIYIYILIILKSFRARIFVLLHVGCFT